MVIPHITASVSEESESLAFDPSTDHISKPKPPNTNRLKKSSPLVKHILKLFNQIKVNIPYLNAI